MPLIWSKDARARRWLRNCAYVGADLHLAGRPSIEPEGGQVRIGDRFRLASIPVPSHLVAGPGAVLDIGNDVAVGCGAAISAYQHVRIGDGTRIAPFVIIMDTNFHSAGEQSLSHDTRPVSIGKGCRIGARVTITRGATIGDGAEILAGSVVSSVIPPGVCAAGARARIIGRAGDLGSRWDSPAAALPEMMMVALGLDSTPDLDEKPIPASLLLQPAGRSLVAAIKDRFGVVLDDAALRTVNSYADFAQVVQRANARR